MPTPAESPKSSLVVHLKTADGDSVPTVIGPSVRPPVTEALALAVGSTLGHFEIIGPLGSGGMASVLKARDTHLGRLVALKILPPEAAKDADSVARFKQEARAAARLDHDNVARVFFSGEDRGLHFIAFEFVEGETLRARMERFGRLPVAESVRFLLHCAAGLQHLAERGVVHRDIKPSNVVVTPEGRAKLIDLGLARHAESVSVNGGVTQSGVTLGTFDYISPEQARDPRTADVRSDIYSLGCAFYHALTGRPPVPEGTAAVKLSAQQLTAPTDPRELNPDVPDVLAMVLNRMLVKDPARRYQTPAELIADLTDVAAALGLAVETTAETPAVLSSGSHARLTAVPPRFPLGWLVAGAVLIAAGLLVASLTNGPTLGTNTPPWADDPPRDKLVPPVDVPGKDEPKKVPAPADRTVSTAAELVAAARADVAVIRLQPGAVYDLTDTPGLSFSGKKLLIECADPRRPAVVRVAVSPLPETTGTARAGGLTVWKAEEVTVRGVRFAFAEPAATAEGEEPVGVAVVGASKVEIIETAFDDPDPDPKAAKSQDADALYIGTVGPKPTEFAARHSYFGTRRWTGIRFHGPVNGTVAECGFHSVARAVLLSGDADAATEPPSSLTFKHCTFLLDKAAVAVTADSVRAAVSVGFCAFAAPSAPDPAAMMMTENDRKPAALRVRHIDPAAVSFTAIKDEPSGYFRTDIPASAVGSDSVEVPVAPWKQVPPSPDKAAPWKALELNPAVRAVRVSKPAGVHILGATRLPAEKGRLYADWPPGSATANAPKPGVKVWYPNPPAEEKGRLHKDEYEDLQKAIDALTADGSIHIRARGPVKVPPVILAKPIRITIEPDENCHPVLIPAGDGPMFRIDDGELRLERLHFRLTMSDETSGSTVAAVRMAGGKRCSLLECTLTADDKVSDHSAAVHLAAPARAADTRPDVRFEKCLIRGNCRLVRMPSAAPATVAVTNSVVALGGPVIDLGSADANPPQGATFRARFDRATVLLVGPLVDAARNEGDGAPFVSVQLDAEAALFAPLAAPSAPLLRVSNGDPTDLARYFQWNGTANRFANFAADATFLDVPPKKWDSADWLMFTKEKKGALGKVTFSRPPLARDVASVLPADAVITDGALSDEVGAKPAQLPDPPEK